MTQTQKVLKHLQSGKTISPLEAFGLFGIFRLAARIFDLRKLGHDIIQTIKGDGYGRTYAEYRLAE